MHTVNMLQAKSSLSRLVEAIERGQESEIVIARLGVAKGKFEVPDSIDELNEALATLFHGEQTD